MNISCWSSCPGQIDIPVFIRAVAEGDYSKAVTVIKEKVPFPATLGRICFHPCESTCKRREIDDPLSICRLVRFAAAMGDYQPIPKDATGKRIAIVGSGPAGLTAAYFLRLLGHYVVVFERLEKPGGMLRVGISAFRLPKDVLEKEIERIVNLGIEIRTNTVVTNPSALLENGFDAVFIATGAHHDMPLGIPGEDNPGVLKGLSFLRDVSFQRIVPLGDRVAVIGGGNVAVEAARTALRLGAEKVSVFYRRSKKEMFALKDMVGEAEREGVKFEFLFYPKKIVAKSQLEISFARMELGNQDDSGRKRPIEISGIEITKSFTSVILAAGQKPGVPDCFGITGKLSVDPATMETGIPGIFAGGDVVTGPVSVIEAIAAGRRAADNISRYLACPGLDQLFPTREKPAVRLVKNQNFLSIPKVQDGVAEWKYSGERFSMDMLKKNFFETNLGIVDEKDAIAEAQRCLQCDLRLYIRDPNKPPAIIISK